MSTAGQTITCKAAVAYAPGEPLSVEDIQVSFVVSSGLIPKVYDVRGLKDAAAKARTLLEQPPLPTLLLRRDGAKRLSPRCFSHAILWVMRLNFADGHACFFGACAHSLPH